METRPPVVRRRVDGGGRARLRSVRLVPRAPRLRGRRWLGVTVTSLALSTSAAGRLQARDGRLQAPDGHLQPRDVRNGAPPPPSPRRGRIRTIVVDDGARLHCRVIDRGHGAPTYVLTHGLCCDERVWAPLVADLADHGRVVTWDLRGHGVSSGAVTSLTCSRLAGDLGAVVDGLAAGPVILVGHSLGGMIALRYLLDETAAGRRRVIGAVLAATPASDFASSVVRGRGLTRAEAQALRVLMRTLLGDRRVAQTFMSTDSAAARARSYAVVRATGFGRRPAADQVALIRDLVAATPAEVRSRTFAAMCDTDLRGQLGTIEVPTLMVFGARDRLVNPAHMLAVTAELPNGRPVVFGGAGHAVILERTEDIARRTIRLAEQALGGAVDLASVAAG